MSEFIAEAQVLVRPNTEAFRALLTAQLAAVTKGIVVPIAITPVASKGVAGAAAATQTLSASTSAATRSSLELAGAQKTLDAATRKSTASLLGANTASERLNAGLLGLRTAIGSSAVIGLGALSLAAIAAGAAVAASIKNFAQFQQELATFRVTAGASADEMKQVSAAAVALGEDVRLPAVSSADAAVAMTELAKAGLSVEDAMAGARGVLELATAAQLSNADAAQIAANALNSFGLAGDQAARVADDFANAANAAQGSIADIGIALQQSSAVARQVGLSLEDTTALLSLFAKNGLQGSDAGTSLRVALIKLVAPTEKAQEEIDLLAKSGFKIRDAFGNVNANVFASFGEATRQLTPAARDAAAALIFGQDAIRAVSIGAREGAEGLRLMQFEIDQTGTAAEVAGARTEGLAGQFSALQSNLQTLGVEFGNIISVPLTPFLQGINTGLSDINKLGQALLGLKNITIPPIHIPFAFDFPGVSIPGGDLAKSLSSSIARQLEGAIPIAGPTLQFLNLTKDLQQFITGTDEAKAKIRSLEVELRSLQQARVQAEKGGATNIADQLTKQINSLKNEINGLKSAGTGIHDGVTKNLQEAVTTLQLLKDATRGQDIPFINGLIASLQRSIPIMVQTEGNIQRLRDDVGDLGTNAQNSAGGVDALTKSLADLGRQASQAQADLLKLQSEGGTPTQIVGALQADVDAQREIIRIRQQNGNQPGDATAIQKARQQIISDNNQIESIQAGIVSDQKAAASKAEAAAKESQKARDKQFEALAETFGGRQGGIENQIERAGIAGNIQKQINLTQALVKSLQKERAALLDRLKKLKVSNETRKKIMQAITAAIEDAKQDILRFQKEQQDNVKDFATPALDLRIRISQARDNVAAEIKARQAKLAAITKELVKLKKAGKKNTLAWLELKAQQAEEAAAIRELEGETKDKSNVQSQFFNFLQAQQGFASNLLGNLIPGFATAGLVGGSSPEPGQPMLAGPQERASAVADVGTAKNAGVRPVQVDTTNSLLRQILAALNGRHTQPPEAAFNRRAGSAMFDTL